MQPHSNYPALAGLDDIVHKQRRLVAGEIRIIRERRALEAQIEEALRTAGVEAVTCRINLGTFEVRRSISRDGRHYASVAPLDARAARETPTLPTPAPSRPRRRNVTR
jgi:hypothetical protein